MSRRAFLRAALLAPLAAAGGCRFSFEQGLFNACRSGIEPAAVPWVEKAWQGLRPDRVWDVHAHVYGNGRGGVGIVVGPELDKPQAPAARARRAFFMNGGCVGEDDDRVDQRMVARLLRLADELPQGAKKEIVGLSSHRVTEHKEKFAARHIIEWTSEYKCVICCRNEPLNRISTLFLNRQTR